MSVFGFYDRVIEIDLGTGTVAVRTLAESEWRAYVGGGLMGVRRLLLQTPPGLDAFDPAAPLMFFSSVVAGHPYVGLARCAVVAKSPLTGGIGESRVEGPFGQALKASGFGGIVVSGRAPSPTYLTFVDGVVTFHDGSSLWGLDSAETTDVLCERHGLDSHVATIGLAGERLVRFASIVTDRTHPAARMGLGAVMGAKNLKAIVLRGGATPACDDPTRLAELTESYREQMRHNVLTESQYSSPGFGAWIVNAPAMVGYVGSRNFTTSRMPALEEITTDAFVKRVIPDENHCLGCPNECVKLFANELDDRAGGLHEETLGAFALGLGITDLDTLLWLNAACHLWGVDPVSLASTIAFVCEVGERGLLGSATLRGRVPTFGEYERLVELLEDVALSRPGVEWLAQGVRRAAEHLGPDTHRYAMQVKGLEMSSFDPRASAGQALAFAVSPLGPRYEIVEHDIDFDPVDGYPHGLDQMRSLGFPNWVPMEELDADRVVRTNFLLELWSGLDALCVSLFAGPPVRELTLSDIATLVSSVTGWTISEDDVLGWGRRRWQLMRVYNLREGVSADSDCLPMRFHEEPIDAGRHNGVLLEESNFRRRVREYYDLVGWDERGQPTDATLRSLDLAWASA
jgi:aldehyde:ferredoxin oxidoreductase